MKHPDAANGRYPFRQKGLRSASNSHSETGRRQSAAPDAAASQHPGHDCSVVAAVAAPTRLQTQKDPGTGWPVSGSENVWNELFSFEIGRHRRLCKHDITV